MNILLTCVGRRSYLVGFFENAIQLYGGKVFVANTCSDSAAMYGAQRKVLVPSSASPEYVPFLLEFCSKNDIGLIFSLHDLDVLVLSRNKHRFIEAGILPVVPDEPW